MGFSGGASSVSGRVSARAAIKVLMLLAFATVALCAPRAAEAGHNSSGVTDTGLRWGLAEGRIGGDRVFDTYILLANPSTTLSKVRVTDLRESGAPIVKLYDVPATSRFNIDVKTEVPELLNSSFGADIEVLNDVPIAVERSLYWNAVGAFWAGGTNALATPLPPVP